MREKGGPLTALLRDCCKAMSSKGFVYVEVGALAELRLCCRACSGAGTPLPGALVTRVLAGMDAGETRKAARARVGRKSR